MVDRLKALWEKVLTWWNKFTAKQKTLIIGVAAAVIFAFAILIWVFTQPTYQDIRQCSNTKEASEVVNVLEGADIKYETSSDGLRISVLKADVPKAELALGAAGIPSTGMTIDDVTNGGFSSTETDKERRYLEFRRDDLEAWIESMDSVKQAKIQLTMPEQDGLLIHTEQEATAAVFLELSGDFTEENAAYVARAMATALGNATTNNITILDMSGHLLFSGDSQISVGGVANSQLSARQQQESLVQNSVRRVLLGTGQFNAVEVACSLDIDFSSTSSQTQTYSAPEGQTQGMLDEETIYSAESTGSNGGIPGTTSNSATDNNTSYQFRDYSDESSTESEEHRSYLPNSYSEVSEIPPGKVNYANSSATITAINYNVIKEEDARRQGLLEGLSWDEYKASHSEPTKLTIDEEFYSAVATATGINVENITIMAYSRNEFIDSEGLAASMTDIVSVVLIILILALLGFVVIRSMRSKKEEEPAEELSVETLLQSTPEEELMDIEAESKSDTRKMIEKFVDENPEAAANLLRNWLNEDWG